MTDDRRWQLLEDARPLLLEAFAEKGVVRIEFVGAFPELDSIGVWLCTASDGQRDVLDRPVLGEAVRRILLRVGFTPEELGDLATVVESQETVDRDYEGSWYYAMR